MQIRLPLERCQTLRVALRMSPNTEEKYNISFFSHYFQRVCQTLCRAIRMKKSPVDDCVNLLFNSHPTGGIDLRGYRIPPRRARPSAAGRAFGALKLAFGQFEAFFFNTKFWYLSMSYGAPFAKFYVTAHFARSYVTAHFEGGVG